MKVKSKALHGAEFGWFAPICDGDDSVLGERSDRYKSNWQNTSEILLKADKLGYKNILCPSSYQVGQDTWTFAAAIAPLTKNINLLTAVRTGEVHPPMLARAIATLDHILKGRLTINIISSNLPGTEMSSADRYQRSREVIEILKQAWSQDRIEFEGKYFNFSLDSRPVKPYQQDGGPLLYFGGYSPQGLELCAEHCDVYLMWPETVDRIQSHMENVASLAEKYDRTIDYGLRIHVIVRETESEARGHARHLMSKIDPEHGKELRERALDAKSLGVARQAKMRSLSDSEGFVEDYLWTGIGKARSGCGAAIVGNPDQVAEKIRAYMALGIRAFILSGYPHAEECELFARYVLPQFENISLPHTLGRVPVDTPQTPLGAAKRI